MGAGDAVSIMPTSTAGVQAGTPMPSRSAARHSSDRSPDGSAAASYSSRRVWMDKASSWRPKLASIRWVSAAAAPSPLITSSSCPASSAPARPAVR